MFTLLYILLAVLFLTILAVLIVYKIVPSIWRALVSFGFLTWLLNIVFSHFLKNYFWISSDLPNNYLLGFWIISALLIAVLFELFDHLFTSKRSIPTNFIAVLLLLLGGASIFLTKYDLMFYSLITIGALLLVSKFILPKHFASRAYWLTLLYILPVAFLLSFLLLEGNFILSPLSADLIPIQVLGVNLELILSAIVITKLFLLIYLLPWQFITRPFRKFSGRIRIQYKH